MTRRVWLAVALGYLAVVLILVTWKVAGLDAPYFDQIGF